MTRLLCLILLILIETVNTNARQPRQLTTADGLSANAVHSIVQDNRGVLWFGTADGLHSYDGNSIHAWRDPSVHSLGANIWCVEVGPDDKLWVGSDNGLSVFDLKKEKFEDFKANSAFGYSINSAVRDIMTDHRGRIWIATYGQGLFRFDPATNDLVQYAAMAKINSDFPQRIYEDSSHNIWVTTRDNGISLYLSDKDYFKPIATNELQNTVSLYEDSRKNLWVGTTHGLFLLDKETMIPKQVVAPPDGNSVLQIRQIIEFPEGKLLFVSDSGVGSYTLDSGSTHISDAIASIQTGLNDNHLHCIYKDNEDGLWIGSYFGGVNYIPALKSNFRNLSHSSGRFPGRIVGVVEKATDKNIWIGTDESGFYLWNRNDDTFKAFDSKNPGSPPTYNNVHAILQSGDSLFVGMYMGGLDIINLKTGKFSNHKSSGDVRSLYSSNVYSLLKSSSGEIWVGTSAGLNRFSPATGDFDRIFEVGRADVECLFEDSHGNIYALSTDKGIFIRNSADGSWENYNRESRDGLNEEIPSNNFICVAEDRDGVIWLGTDGAGLLKYDSAKRDFSQIPLPSELRTIDKIIPFEDRLWISSNKGLYCFYPTSGMLLHFSKDEGVAMNSFRPNSGLMLPDGTILLGGTDGLLEFLPQDFSPVAQKPKVILTDFRLFHRPVDVDSEDSPLSTSLSYADKLVLDHDQSDFSFNIAVMSYAKPSLNNVAYLLEGYDKDWKETGEDHNVSYNNLPPGKYTFRVKTADGLGGWNEDALTLPVEVRPPWWSSNLMIVIYILLAITLIRAFMRYYTRRQRRKFDDLIRQKEQEDDKHRLEFFTQMAHELRTPLTLILSPLEAIMKSKGDVETAMPQLKVMERNGKRLLTLVNQLMDFRKLESGAVKVTLRKMSLRAELRSMIHSFSSHSKKRDIEFITSYPDNDCIAIMDREAFSHIVGNLISNALKFAKTKVEICLKAEPKGFYSISVSDDGPGIAEEEKDNIFKPFYQIKENRPDGYIGTGLGLMLVKEYVRLVDGEISVNATSEGGACFTVKFHADEDNSSISDSQADSPAISGNPIIDEISDEGLQESETRPSILVVEDNSDMREFLSSQLDEEFSVLTASNGAEAISIIEKTQIDLVLSDVMMPVMDGFELCRRIKCDIITSHIPVILLTAKAQDEDFVEGYGHGADAYVSKPFSMDIVKAQIDSIIRNRKRIRRNFLANPESEPNIVPNSSLDKTFFDKLTAIVEDRLTDPDFNVDILAREIGISRTGLFNKIKAVCGMTPNGFIKIVRLRKAAALLAHPDARVNEVCMLVGFSSRSHFAKSFQEQFGMSPTDYRASLSE